MSADPATYQTDPKWAAELSGGRPVRNPHEGWPTMMFANPLTGAIPWFAWYPIRTWDYRWRWLCWVERRLMHKKPHLDGPLGNPWWQHRVVWKAPK